MTEEIKPDQPKPRVKSSGLLKNISLPPVPVRKPMAPEPVNEVSTEQGNSVTPEQVKDLITQQPDNLLSYSVNEVQRQYLDEVLPEEPIKVVTEDLVPLTTGQRNTLPPDEVNQVKPERPKKVKTDKGNQVTPEPGKKAEPHATIYFDQAQLIKLDRMAANYFLQKGIRINRNDIVRQLLDAADIDSILKYNIIPKRDRGGK